MVGERIQSRRPFTAPMLELVITETPVPVEGEEPAFPMSVIRSSDTMEEAKSDVVETFQEAGAIDGEGDVKSEFSADFKRGFGETREFKFLVNADGEMPSDLANGVDRLVAKGYKFDSVMLK